MPHSFRNHLFVLMAGLLFLPSTAMADVWLVAVGVSDYPGTANDLRLPANDATTIAHLYRQNTQAHTILLTNRDANLANISRAMESLYSEAAKNDIIVFFFSGHGGPGHFYAYDGKLSYDIIRQAMAGSKSRHKMIFADACHSGKMRQEGHTDRPITQDVMLFLSCRDKEYSIERRTMKNGYFTACLERCLRGGADVNQDRTITASELFNGVSAGVIKLSHDRQHPVMWGNFDDDMPVIIWPRQKKK